MKSNDYGSNAFNDYAPICVVVIILNEFEVFDFVDEGDQFAAPEYVVVAMVGGAYETSGRRGSKVLVDGEILSVCIVAKFRGTGRKFANLANDTIIVIEREVVF